MLKFDLYRKLPQDLIEPSRSGVVISFTSILIMLVLFINEIQEFMHANIQTVMYIDIERSDQFRVNLDIVLPRMPCDLISIDQQDIVGTHEINLKGELTKTRMQNSQPIGLLKPGDVDLERAKQAFQDGEGCHLLGYLYLQKVPGNFHISAHPYGGHLNSILPYVALQTIDLSHEIRHLSFGEQNELDQIKEQFREHGILNPLDGIIRMKNRELKHIGVMHQYYISVVPTTYIFGDGQSHYVHQFTANTNEGQTNQMPAIYFRYEISPVTVEFSKYYETWGHLAVQLCAILGGVVTIAGIVDQIVYQYQKQKVYFQ